MVGGCIDPSWSSLGRKWRWRGKRGTWEMKMAQKSPPIFFYFFSNFFTLKALTCRGNFRDDFRLKSLPKVIPFPRY